jgi:hypothetical protein
MSRRRITVGLIFFVVIAAVAWVVHGAFTTWRGIPDAYAAWDTGILVVEYLETHDDQWPRSWDELLTATQTLEANGKHLPGGNGVYGDLPGRVAIDWNADPDEIAAVPWKGGRLPVRVVTRADGSDFPVVWEHGEPNEIIWRYLQRRDAD